MNQIPMPNDETACRARCGGLSLVWAILFFFAVSSLKAEIKVENLEWEPACEGSNIQVISEDGKILFVEAGVQHFAEAREWTCTFKDGMLLSACYRHLLITRKPKGEDGEFELDSKLDRVETFVAERGVIPRMSADLKKDLDELLRLSRESVKPPNKP